MRVRFITTSENPFGAEKYVEKELPCAPNLGDLVEFTRTEAACLDRAYGSGALLVVLKRLFLANGYLCVTVDSEPKDIISTLEQTSVIDERYLLDLSELHLDKSIVTRLRNNANCNTVGDIMKKGRKELLSTPNIGSISIQYIEEALERIGICFK